MYVFMSPWTQPQRVNQWRTEFTAGKLHRVQAHSAARNGNQGKVYDVAVGAPGLRGCIRNAVLIWDNTIYCNYFEINSRYIHNIYIYIVLAQFYMHSISICIVHVSLDTFYVYFGHTPGDLRLQCSRSSILADFGRHRRFNDLISSKTCPMGQVKCFGGWWTFMNYRLWTRLWKMMNSMMNSLTDLSPSLATSPDSPIREVLLCAWITSFSALSLRECSASSSGWSRPQGCVPCRATL